MAVIDPNAKYWSEGRIIMSGVAAMGGQRLFDADNDEHAERIVRQLNRYDDLHTAAGQVIECLDTSPPSGATVQTAMRIGNLGVAVNKLRNYVQAIK